MPNTKPVKRYFTVVFEITNEENFTGMFAGPFTKSLAEDSDIIEGVKVTACGTGDVMTQADAMTSWLENNGEDVDALIAEVLAEGDMSREDIEATIG